MSTVLSLVFVPSFYTVMDDIGWVIWRIFGRFVGPSDEPAGAHNVHAAGLHVAATPAPHRAASPLAAE